jgi:hypothetical protein
MTATSTDLSYISISSVPEAPYSIAISRKHFSPSKPVICRLALVGDDRRAPGRSTSALLYRLG